MEIHAVVLLIATMRLFCLGTDVETCISPQHLELGKVQVIHCHFQDGFYAVAWYNSDEVTQNNLLIRQINGLKQGIGYSSGEFDIQMDGSLVMRNVTLQHDHKFTVWIFRSQDDVPVSLVVKVIVTVKPLVNSPVIDLCEEKPLCLTQINPGSNVTCFFRDVRPAVSLSWVARTADGDMEVSFVTSVIDNNPTYTSRATISSAFLHPSLLSLLVCKANVSTWTFLQHESVIFVENSNINLTNVESVSRYVKRDSQLRLSCSDGDSGLILWKYTEQLGSEFRIISYDATFAANVSKIYSADFKLQSDGSLIVSHTQTRHDGLYGCVFENEDARGMALYNVTVFVAAYPVVHGCTLSQYCVLSMPFEGSLTCSVNGIRPKVQLEWRTLDVRDSSLIMFSDHDQEITTSTNGDTYDIQITSKYRLQQTSRNRLTLECGILEPNITAFSSTAKFDLLINSIVPPTVNQPTVIQPNENDAAAVTNTLLWITIIIIIVVVCLCALYLIAKGQQEKKKRLTKNQYELNPMISNSDHPVLKKDVFISELRAKYKNLYEAIQPIPYIRDRLYCVNRVFVEGGIVYKDFEASIGGKEMWIKLPTYRDILGDSRLESTTYILEGGPGYGKSMITLQLTYDWCNKVSYLKNTDILILLRLRQLSGMTSFYKAIKQLLLPKDSNLTESDIKELCKCSSLLVVLDGYDEYPDQDSGADSDIISIIKNEMLQMSEVVLTTRSSYLPKEYPPLAKRFRLTGFDNNARDDYIRKAVVGDDNKAAKNVMQLLKKSPALADLCQVPLFFVMFAHMSYEGTSFPKNNSVTSFFLCVISCIHSHMKNKMKDANVKQYDLFELQHKELDKLAFDGVNRKVQQIVWGKEEMCKQLGKPLYDQYVRIGILVEEDVLDMSGNIQYKTEVRFYHKVFCEWYAAHYLSEYASRDDVTFESDYESEGSVPDNDPSNDGNFEFHKMIITTGKEHFLKHLDQSDLQYVYRFACGLNPLAADKIIGYLKNIQGGSRLAFLCIFEKSGKIENILPVIKKLCSQQIDIDDDHSLMLQRSTVQLLETALAFKISVSWVYLDKCFETVDDFAGTSIKLKSKLSVPVLPSMKKLTIEEVGKEITTKDMTGLLKYLSMCLELEEMVFINLLLPQFVPTESLSALKSRHFKVFWTTNYASYRLDISSGIWEHVSKYRGVMTDEDYHREVNYFKKQHGPPKTEIVSESMSSDTEYPEDLHGP